MNNFVQFLPISVDESFLNLIQFSVVGCSVKNVIKENLKGLKKLTFLDLRNNQIEAIEENSFDDLIELEILTMSKNKVKFLDENLFLNVQKLKYLDFSINSFNKLDAKFFKKLIKLEKLDLYGNSLKIIDKNLIESLSELKCINFKSNFCIDEVYGNCNLLLNETEREKIKNDLKKNCA